MARTFPRGMARGPHVLWLAGNAAGENSGAPVDRLWKIWDKVSAEDRRLVMVTGGDPIGSGVGLDAEGLGGTGVQQMLRLARGR